MAGSLHAEATAELEGLLDALEMDGISVAPKNATKLGRAWWKAVHFLVMIVTFGGQRRMARYTTTIGPWIRTGDGFGEMDPLGQLVLLEHEKLHVEQFRTFGLGVSAILGIIPAGICYLLLPLPIGFAWCRYAMERSAYARGAEVRAGFAPSQASRYAVRAKEADRAAERLSSGAYGWAWIVPGSARRWMRKRLKLTD